jgi:hypothetical protein
MHDRGGSEIGSLDAAVDSDGENQDDVRQLQSWLNDYAARFRLEELAVDGERGAWTEKLYTEIVWRLGLFATRTVPENDETATWALIEKPERRTAEQVGRERRRALNMGPTVTGEHVVRGVRMLRLIGDFDVWVHRRVETHAFGSEDPAVFIRKKSIDFTFPVEAARELGTASGACPIPITLVNKWRLPRFDIRDEANNSIPLLARDEHMPLTTGMLIALAYRVCVDAVPPISPVTIPREIEEDLRAIVSEESDTAVSICDQLGAMAMGADTPAAEAKRAITWRRQLVTSEVFMELAYELAQNFLVLVLCPAPVDARRILKMSYEMPVDRPVGKRIGGKWRALKARITGLGSDDDWLASAGERPEAVGSLILSSACETLTVGSRQTGEAPAPCVLVRVLTPQQTDKTFALSTQDVREIPNMPEGEYQLQIRTLSGFQLTGATLVKVVIDRDEPARESIHCTQLQVSKRVPRAIGIPLPTLTLGRRLTRGLAWRSRSLLIKYRLGEGGSYHLEFEAPPGLQVTRAKVVDDRRGELDIVLRTVQRSHLYVPASISEPATGYALVNLRPRPETVVRGATITAGIATAAVIAVAVRWQVTGHAGSNGLALLLGLPGLLAAYFAYAVPNSVTNNLVVGLRVVALAPGIMAFGAAALVLDGDAEQWALVTLYLLLIAMVSVTVALAVALRYSLHPAEQRSTPKAQSPGFARRYLSEPKSK